MFPGSHIYLSRPRSSAHLCSSAPGRCPQYIYCCCNLRPAPATHVDLTIGFRNRQKLPKATSDRIRTKLEQPEASVSLWPSATCCSAMSGPVCAKRGAHLNALVQQVATLALNDKPGCESHNVLKPACIHCTILPVCAWWAGAPTVHIGLCPIPHSISARCRLRGSVRQFQRRRLTQGRLNRALPDCPGGT